MKLEKIATVVGLVGLLSFFAFKILHAGPAAIYLTPPNPTSQIYQDTSGNINFVDASTGPVTLITLFKPTAFPQTLAQLQASTPTAFGQLVYCSNCATASVCVGTGTAVAYSWSTVNTRTTQCN